MLRALLPELGTDIKGHMRSLTEVREASGCRDRPSDFNDLLRILDGELRLITPTDPEGHESQSKSDLGSQYYQLTHDYLVPSLREWLTRKQKETRKGRQFSTRGGECGRRPVEGGVTEGSNGLGTCSLVLHRPLIPDAAKESLALKQAAAATALLRLNAPDKVWPLFQDQPDPRLRSYVLHRVAT